MMKKLNLAIIGQGRSGRDIHGVYYKSKDNTLFNVVSVVDQDEFRLEKAKKEYGCEVFSDYKQLYGRTDIDLVVNSTFSYMHYPITIDLLTHGFNVLSEKPFARYSREVDDMIATARACGKKLAVFQQSRVVPYFLKIKEIIKSGVLGNLIQISIHFNGYARRWDWQCSQRFYGGSLLNTGPHPMDQALNLLDVDGMPNIFSKLNRVNTSGDAEDYAKIILTAPNRPLIDVEISSCDAYNNYLYNIQGSKGCLKATMNEVEWKYFIPENEPQRQIVLTPLSTPEGNPAYCGESLTWHEEKELLSGDAFNVAVASFYQNLYNNLTNDTPLIVSLEEVRQQIAVIEEIHKQNPLSIKY